MFAFGLAASIAWIAAVYRSVPAVRVGVAGIPSWSASHARPLCAAAVAALLMGGAFLGKQRRTAPDDGAAPRRRRRIVRLVPWRVRNRLSRIARGTRRTSVRLVDLVRRAAGWVAAMLWKLILGADRPRPTGGSRPSPLLVTILMAAGGGVAGYALFSLAPSASLWTTVQRSPYLWTLTPITLVLATFVIWTAARTGRPRRPLLLVIDDLDRCPAERVVKLLETVHTLLRERPDVQVFPAWRKAAPFVVLVLGDGRWIRRSFETGYETFQTLGSDVHGLGADFLQKVFDHVVLVPALAADQVQAYVDDVTEVSHWVVTGPRRTGTPAPAATSTRSSNAAQPPDAQPANAATGRKGHALPTDAEDVARQATADMESKDTPAPVVEAPPETDIAPATLEAERVIAATSPSQVLSSGVQQAIRHAPAEDRQRLAEEAAGKAASKEAMAAFSEHLLAAYAPIMPANPRLVTRVANTFGMLMVLRIHLGHHEPEDYIARAAIVFVRFPTLVDTLLSDPDPPTIDPTTAPTDADTKDTTSSPWFRRDVQHVLRDEHNQLIDIVRLARCFGREYEPAIPTPTTAATASTPAAQTDITKLDGATTLPQRQHDNRRTRR
jgi:hypothetical protein